MHRASGRYLSLSDLVLRALAGRIDADEVEAECEAQCAAIEAAGIALTHIDSHRHTHALPGIRGAVARVAARRKLPLRRPVESLARFSLDVPVQLHRLAVAGAWWTTSASATHTRAADHFVGMALQGGMRFAERLAATLDALPTRSCELMVHPGRVDDALSGVDAYTWQREMELASLVSPEVRHRVSSADIALINFAQL
jgi:predicted glycoside hydrolase/deacetylase ChbG (UPF0249 family)